MAERVGEKDFDEKVKQAKCLVLTELFSDRTQWIDKYLKGADE